MKQLELAPIQGHTDSIYRDSFQKVFGGIDKFYSPFMRLDNDNTIRRKYLKDIEPVDGVALTPQLLVNSKEQLMEIISQIDHLNYKELDINMGCPYSPVVKRGYGSALIGGGYKDILEGIDQLKDYSISVKARLGITDPDQSLELIEALNSSSVSFVTVHARTQVQQYKGEVNLDAFQKVYDACKKPLIYNGDIRTVKDYNSIVERFPDLKSVMLGRGVLADPALPLLIKGEEVDKSKYLEFHQILFDRYSEKLNGDSHILTKMKAMWEYFLPETEKKTLKGIKKCQSIKNYLSFVATIR